MAFSAQETIIDPSSVGIWAGSFDIDKLYTNEAALFAILLLVLLVLFLFSLSISSLKSLESAKSLRFFQRKKAENLFLKVTLALPGYRLESGYLRSLGLKEATLVTAEPLNKGGKLGIRLDSLPAFPSQNIIVDGEVVSKRSLGGNPEKFLVRIRFTQLSEVAKAPLHEYLDQLCDHPALLNRA